MTHARRPAGRRSGWEKADNAATRAYELQLRVVEGMEDEVRRRHGLVPLAKD